MQPYPLQFYLMKDLTTYYRWDGSAAQETQTPTLIEVSPDGWAETAVANGRNFRMAGFSRDYSTSYKFTGAGASIIRWLRYNKGTEAKCVLRCDRQRTTPDDLTHVLFFRCALDFGKSMRDEDDFIQANLKELGLEAQIKSLEDTEYEIPVYGDPDAIDVVVPGMLVRAQIKYLSAWPLPSQNGQTGSIQARARLIYYVLTEETQFATTSGNPAEVKTQEAEEITVAGQLSGNNYLLKANTALYNVRVKGALNYYGENNDSQSRSFGIRISKFVPNTSQTTNIYVVDTVTLAAGLDTVRTPVFTSPFFNLAAGEKLMFEIGYSGHPSQGNLAWQDGMGIEIEFQNYTDDISFKALRGQTLLKRLVSKITNNTANAHSDLLTNTAATHAQGWDNRPCDTVFTSGDAIASRKDGAGNPKQTIKTSLSDFTKAADCEWSTGLSIESGQVRLEKKGRYFDPNTTIVELTDVVKVAVEHMDDLYANGLSIGYEPYTYDGVNGRDEFNTTHRYTLPVTTVNKMIDMVSPYRADMYGFLFTWLRNIKEPSRDDEADNDVFMLEVEPTATNGKYRALSLNGIKQGIADPAHSFNFGLSPKRMLFRNGAFIRSMLYKLDAEQIVFQLMDKNPELYSFFTAGVVDEDRNEYISLLAQALFQPYVFNVEARSPMNILDLLEQTPWGVIKFPWRGRTWAGFPLTAGIKSAYPDTYQFRLLSSPLNNLSLLAQ